MKKKKFINIIVLVGLLFGCYIFLIVFFFIFFLFFEIFNILIVILVCLCGINFIVNLILYCMKIESV